MDEQTKVTVLLKAFEHTQDHGQQLRARAMAVQTWIGSVFLAVIGGIVALGPGTIASFGREAQIALTAVAATLLAFAWITEVFTFRARVEQQKASLRVTRLLLLFDVNYFAPEHPAIFDEAEWSGWTRSLLRRWGVSPTVAVLVILTVIVALLIWMA